MLEKTTFCELKRKEVINICDGACLGSVCDVALDVCTGTILSIVVPGPSKCFGLLRSEEDFVIPFCRVKKFGEDVILVEISP